MGLTLFTVLAYPYHMTNTLLALVSAVILAGCAANPAVPECGGWRLLAANAGTFGMYGMANCVGRGDAARRAADWDRDIGNCVAQGGDPAACRAAVYAPRRAPVFVYQTPYIYRYRGY